MKGNPNTHCEYFAEHHCSSFRKSIEGYIRRPVGREHDLSSILSLASAPVGLRFEASMNEPWYWKMKHEITVS
jgi:hypothetical protein